MEFILKLVDQENFITYAIFLIAGTIKGMLGVGLPTSAIALLCIFFEPSYAISLMPIPKLITNFRQFYSVKDKMSVIKRYRFFSFASVFSIIITSYFFLGSKIDLRLFIGIVIIFFCLTQILKVKIKIKEEKDSYFQLFFGFFGGFVGALTTIWSPSMMVYLLSKNLKKEEFIAAAGYLLSVVSVPLFFGYLAAGLIDEEIFITSILGCFFAILGFNLGAKLRNLVSEIIFKYFLLLFFFISGLRMIMTSTIFM